MLLLLTREAIVKKVVEIKQEEDIANGQTNEL